MKIFKQYNRRLLFDALSNGSTFLDHPVGKGDRQKLITYLRISDMGF